MNISKTSMAAIAAATLFAAPLAAQNTAVVVDNAISDVGNTADAVGNSIATGANSVATAADNAVDIDINTDPSMANSSNMSTMPMDGNMVMDDANMTDPMMDDNMVTTTTTTTMQNQQQGGNGRWGLLGLLGLAGFLFRPKRAAIHLDERNGR